MVKLGKIVSSSTTTSLLSLVTYKGHSASKYFNKDNDVCSCLSCGVIIGVSSGYRLLLLFICGSTTEWIFCILGIVSHLEDDSIVKRTL